MKGIRLSEKGFCCVIERDISAGIDSLARKQIILIFFSTATVNHINTLVVILTTICFKLMCFLVGLCRQRKLCSNVANSFCEE